MLSLLRKRSNKLIKSLLMLQNSSSFQRSNLKKSKGKEINYEQQKIDLDQAKLDKQMKELDQVSKALQQAKLDLEKQTAEINKIEDTQNTVQKELTAEVAKQI